MIRFVVGRALQGAVTLLFVAVLVFLITSAIGDPVLLLLPPEHTQEQYEQLRHELGYDRPLPVQFVDFIAHAVTGDFGTSTQFNRPALSVIGSRFPVTGFIAVLALCLGLVLGLPLGVLAAMRKGSVSDTFAAVVATVGLAIPSFVVGIVLILVFAVNARLLPAGGWGSPPQIVLPVLSLAIGVMSMQIRLMRTSMIDVLRSPYVLLARAKGLDDGWVVLRHALRPSLSPVITYGGLQLGALLTGAVITESVFGIPGLGKLLVDAVAARDQALIRAAVVIGAAGFLVVNVLVDIVCAALDPRVRIDTKAARG